VAKNTTLTRQRNPLNEHDAVIEELRLTRAAPEQSRQNYGGLEVKMVEQAEDKRLKEIAMNVLTQEVEDLEAELAQHQWRDAEDELPPPDVHIQVYSDATGEWGYETFSGGHHSV